MLANSVYEPLPDNFVVALQNVEDVFLALVRVGLVGLLEGNAGQVRVNISRLGCTGGGGLRLSMCMWDLRLRCCDSTVPCPLEVLFEIVVVSVRPSEKLGVDEEFSVS